MAIHLIALKFHYDEKHQSDQQKTKVDILGWSTALRMAGGARPWGRGQRWFRCAAGCDRRFVELRMGCAGMWWGALGALGLKAWNSAGISRWSVWAGRILGGIVWGYMSRTDCCAGCLIRSDLLEGADKDKRKTFEILNRMTEISKMFSLVLSNGMTESPWITLY